MVLMSYWEKIKVESSAYAELADALFTSVFPGGCFPDQSSLPVYGLTVIAWGQAPDDVEKDKSISRSRTQKKIPIATLLKSAIYAMGNLHLE